MGSWVLHVQASSSARLMFPAEEAGTLRIEISDADSAGPFWHIDLEQSHLRMKSGHSYALVFRVRADTARLIGFGVGQAHDPWGNLGLYREVGVTSDWQDIRVDFRASDGDANARIYFHVGGNRASVELSDIQLIRLPGGRAVRPTRELKYFVEYRFNALGCRGRDYATPRPPGTVRIVVLGDSFSLGVGVHEEDVLAAQLERLLNQRARARQSREMYEVINCAVPGYDTHQERLFYDLIASQYEPDIVLVVMAWNDDRSFKGDRELGYIHHPRKLEHLFYVSYAVQRARHKRPPPEFSGSVRELERLNDRARAAGARLAVVAFRTDRGQESLQLVNTVASGLDDRPIPFLDLGEAILEKHAPQELFVHEIDPHPNEIAHKLAAEEVLRFLYGEGLLGEL